MPYINQDQKKVIAAAMKVALKEFPSVKVSLSIQHNSTITCTIKQGPESLKPKNGVSCGVNHYYIDDSYKGDAARILKAINDCLHIGHWDNSDIQSDYFSCAWYVGIVIGTWDKPYVSV